MVRGFPTKKKQEEPPEAEAEEEPAYLSDEECRNPGGPASPAPAAVQVVREAELMRELVELRRDLSKVHDQHRDEVQKLQHQLDQQAFLEDTLTAQRKQLTAEVASLNNEMREEIDRLNAQHAAEIETLKRENALLKQENEKLKKECHDRDEGTHEADRYHKEKIDKLIVNSNKYLAERLFYRAVYEMEKLLPMTAEKCTDWLKLKTLVQCWLDKITVDASAELERTFQDLSDEMHIAQGMNFVRPGLYATFFSWPYYWSRFSQEGFAPAPVSVYYDVDDEGLDGRLFHREFKAAFEHLRLKKLSRTIDYDKPYIIATVIFDAVEASEKVAVFLERQKISDGHHFIVFVHDYLAPVRHDVIAHWKDCAVAVLFAPYQKNLFGRPSMIADKFTAACHTVQTHVDALQKEHAHG